jgi:hypothetical protein
MEFDAKSQRLVDRYAQLVQQREAGACVAELAREREALQLIDRRRAADKVRRRQNTLDSVDVLEEAGYVTAFEAKRIRKRIEKRRK